MIHCLSLCSLYKMIMVIMSLFTIYTGLYYYSRVRSVVGNSEGKNSSIEMCHVPWPHASHEPTPWANHPRCSQNLT